MAEKPRLAFTSGDPAGIGPEIVVKALRSGRLQRVCRPILVGESLLWRRAGWTPELAPIIETRLGLRSVRRGTTDKNAGRASFASLDTAARLAARKVVRGLVTAPISKKAWKAAGVAYPDHTEYFRAVWRRPQAHMILASPRRNLWSILATRHIPLAEVPSRLDSAAILSAARALSGALTLLKNEKRPRLGLCALNPHAGEDGILGREEKALLAPAVKSARRLGLDLRGPIPADSAWRLHTKGILEGLVTLYHDQALIALKACAGLGIVNWTVGLPFVRVSPGHGTALDIAGKNRADPAGLLAAAELAATL
ncbi:MAG: 4-hydroxythreonine-4-phosphate dehydrogenase PdxA [Elusimicrobia bacterium]|nr:4-hydroxythreonine-4-phosphate dehydrogenase PdxA [Elusimicrobiota bacterium]